MEPTALGNILFKITAKITGLIGVAYTTCSDSEYIAKHYNWLQREYGTMDGDDPLDKLQDALIEFSRDKLQLNTECSLTIPNLQFQKRWNFVAGTKWIMDELKRLRVEIEIMKTDFVLESTNYKICQDLEKDVYDVMIKAISAYNHSVAIRPLAPMYPEY